MIGLPAVLIHLLFLIGPIVMLVAFYVHWKKKERSGVPRLIFIVQGGIFVPFVFFILLIGIWQNSHHIYNRWILTNLEAKDVEELVIGTNVVRDSDQIEDIVATLNDLRWFAANHGGWAKQVPLEIQKKNGEEYRFKVAYYLRQEGAVISFYKPHGHGAVWLFGEAFSERLPTVLAKLDMELPKEKY